jgi:hypothetical protein
MTGSTPGEIQWYYVDNKRRIGPVPELEFRHLIESGKVVASTHIWHSGMSSWKPASEVPDCPDLPPAPKSSLKLRQAVKKAEKADGGANLIATKLIKDRARSPHDRSHTTLDWIVQIIKLIAAVVVLITIIVGIISFKSTGSLQAPQPARSRSAPPPAPRSPSDEELLKEVAQIKKRLPIETDSRTTWTAVEYSDRKALFYCRLKGITPQMAGSLQEELKADMIRFIKSDKKVVQLLKASVLVEVHYTSERAEPLVVLYLDKTVL